MAGIYVRQRTAATDIVFKLKRFSKSTAKTAFLFSSDRVSSRRVTQFPANCRRHVLIIRIIAFTSFSTRIDTSVILALINFMLLLIYVLYIHKYINLYYISHFKYISTGNLLFIILFLIRYI